MSNISMQSQNNQRRLQWLPVLMLSVFSIGLLFSEYFPVYIRIGVGFFVYVTAYLFFRKDWNQEESLVLLLILSVPTSFRSFFGSSYGKLPLSWFNIVIFILLMWVLSYGINRQSVVFLFFFLIIASYHIATSHMMGDTIKQVANVTLFLLAVPIGLFLKKRCSVDFRNIITSYYIIGTLVMASLIYVQFTLLKSTGIQVGQYAVYGGGRTSYGGLFSDFSFATLYLMSGLSFSIYNVIEEKASIFNLLKQVIVIAYLFGASLLTSARTGLVSLILAIVIWVTAKIINNRARFIFVALFGIVIAPIALIVMMRGRGGQALFDSSGRGDTYIAGLNAFISHPFWGSGMGLIRFTVDYESLIPHNTFIQYLAQTGLIGVMFLVFYVSDWIQRITPIQERFKLALLTILMGTLMVPDIINSRFLIVLIIITILCGENIDKEMIKKEVEINGTID